MRLAGKVAIVTGAARGIGLAIARAYVAEGARVVLADWLADEVRAQAAGLGSSALAVPTDVGDAGQVRALVVAAVERFGGLDLMVANAAVQAEIHFLDLTEEEFDRVVRVNLKGAFLCGQTAARHMVKTGRRGAIINLTSVNAVVAHPVLVHYAASKGGITMLTKGMAVALAPLSVAQAVNLQHILWLVTAAFLACSVVTTLARRPLWALYLLPATDLVFTTSRHFARHFAKFLPLAILPPPFEFPRMRFYQLWHERCHAAPDIMWIRRMIAEVAADLPQLPRLEAEAG